MTDQRAGVRVARGHAATAAIFFAIACAVLLLPAGLLFQEAQKLAGFGWPGPYDSDVARLNAGEAYWKIQAFTVFILVVLASAAIGSGVAARRAGQRVWLVPVIGVAATAAFLLVSSVVLSVSPADYWSYWF